MVFFARCDRLYAHGSLRHTIGHIVDRCSALNLRMLPWLANRHRVRAAQDLLVNGTYDARRPTAGVACGMPYMVSLCVVRVRSVQVVSCVRVCVYVCACGRVCLPWVPWQLTRKPILQRQKTTKDIP
jgi:hypothetical protein